MTKVTRNIVSGRHSEVVDKKKMKPNRQLAEKERERETGKERKREEREKEGAGPEMDL